MLMMSLLQSAQARAPKKGLPTSASPVLLQKSSTRAGQKSQVETAQPSARKVDGGKAKEKNQTPHNQLSRTLMASELGGAGIGLGGGLGDTGRLVLRGAKKKKPSRLKKIILRERADLALASAQSKVEDAEAQVKAIMAAATSLRTELDSAVESAQQLREELSARDTDGNHGSGILLPDAYTRVNTPVSLSLCPL